MPPRRASSLLSISRSLARFSPLKATQQFPGVLRDSYNQIYSSLEGLARLPGLARRIQAPQLQAEAEMAGMVPQYGGAIMPSFPLALPANEPEADVEPHAFEVQPINPNYPDRGGVRRLNGLPGLWIDGTDSETNNEANDASTVGDATEDRTGDATEDEMGVADDEMSATDSKVQYATDSEM
ncbi:hypothetical protein FRC12_024093 [Ceratobasidium sp. 428]|nr:hypothetical protein FRC12_024093 [Ceratobasidium sp. 428]